MQNKPNVKDAKMNISPFMTIKYVKLDNWCNRKNKPNQTQFKPKTKPIAEIPKMNVSIYYTREYNKITAFRRIQNKPNQTQNKANLIVLSIENSRLCAGN